MSWEQVLPERLEGTRRCEDGRVLAIIPPELDGGRYTLAVVSPDFPAVEGSFSYESLEVARGDMGAWTPGADTPRPPNAMDAGERWEPFNSTPERSH